MTPPTTAAGYTTNDSAAAVLTAWQPARGATAVRDPVRARTAADRQRRVLNVAVAAFGLLLCAPVMLIVALLVKLSSRGPILYTQTRVGLDRRNPEQASSNHRRTVDYGGRLFRIYKFRTMRVNERGERQVWAQRDDPRVTRIGRVLRKYRLDELPQLINVLKGDMNIVGPRPEQPDILIELRTVVTEYPQRQRVLPGLTGWAQINHHYDSTIDDVRRKVQLDLDYIRRRSTLEDLRIMARTVPVVLFQRGGW